MAAGAARDGAPRQGSITFIMGAISSLEGGAGLCHATQAPNATAVKATAGAATRQNLRVIIVGLDRSASRQC
ncbi:MAG TPA: hypothetical protein PKV56_06570 [Burkholderiaceae bacterium]|nr:hypothetical protein [Burkholderiaceae bacterium]